MQSLTAPLARGARRQVRKGPRHGALCADGAELPLPTPSCADDAETAVRVAVDLAAERVGFWLDGAFVGAIDARTGGLVAAGGAAKSKATLVGGSRSRGRVCGFGGGAVAPIAAVYYPGSSVALCSRGAVSTCPFAAEGM
jgi:hypothetical protein